jgi:nicotinate-nucleotide pyrophosphorylase (carboxylating)
VELALKEDLGVYPLPVDVAQVAQPVGDVTSCTLIPPGRGGRYVFVARAAGVLAGLPAVALVAAAVDRRLVFQPSLEDGAVLQPGTPLGVLSGPLTSLLTAERTALNFVQHLSGIATQTRRYVEAIAGLPCRILDTRKTLPGWRLLEKYAVRCGGGQNHRMGLYDSVLIKDNHLAVLPEPRSIAQAIRQARRGAWSGNHAPTGFGDRAPKEGSVPVEVEVETLEQLDEALGAQPDMVLLDNMSLDQLREAVRRRNAAAPNVLLEASGGVTLATVRAIAETGVDRISVGGLTHSAPALDIALDFLPCRPA